MSRLDREAAIFGRSKVGEPIPYIQFVENHRDGKKARQRVIATLRRLDHLQETNALEWAVQSACRVSEQLTGSSPGRGSWADVLRDLDALTAVEIENGGRRFQVHAP